MVARRASRLALAVLLASCRRDPPAPPRDGANSEPSPTVPSVVPEVVPRCRVEGARVAIAGDDVVVGEAAITDDSVFVGFVRREGGRRLASVLRVGHDLAAPTFIDIGPAVGDDPPPSPRVMRGAVSVAYFARKGGDAATPMRELRVARLEATSVGTMLGSVLQQADESMAFDLASTDSDALVAWDEDAPAAPGALIASRGLVKVQLLGDKAKAKTVSPETSDAETPRLLVRSGGYWLAWLARRVETPEDAGAAPEGPGEHRAYRWVEFVALDPSGAAVSPVRRVSPEKGRVVAFELAAVPGSSQVAVLVLDETAANEGGGARVVRYGIDGDRVEASELVDGGVGHSVAELVAAPAVNGEGARRWLAWADGSERALVLPLGKTLASDGPASVEPSLDGARVVAADGRETLYAVAPAAGAGARASRLELRRLKCR